MIDRFHNCDRCGCPRIVHMNDGECLHCKAFHDPLCEKYVLVKYWKVSTFPINKRIFGTYSIMFWMGGLLCGYGLGGLNSRFTLVNTITILLGVLVVVVAGYIILE